jgi:hypothetical protein
MDILVCLAFLLYYSLVRIRYIANNSVPNAQERYYISIKLYHTKCLESMSNKIVGYLHINDDNQDVHFLNKGYMQNEHNNPPEKTKWPRLTL